MQYLQKSKEKRQPSSKREHHGSTGVAFKVSSLRTNLMAECKSTSGNGSLISRISEAVKDEMAVQVSVKLVSTRKLT